MPSPDFHLQAEELKDSLKESGLIATEYLIDAKQNTN
jgi:hypothetical protein